MSVTYPALLREGVMLSLSLLKFSIYTFYLGSTKIVGGDAIKSLDKTGQNSLQNKV